MVPKKWFIIVTDMHCLWIVLVEKNDGESLHNIPGVYLILQKLRSLNTHAAVLQQLQSRWVLGIEIAQTVLNSWNETNQIYFLQAYPFSVIDKRGI